MAQLLSRLKARPASGGESTPSASFVMPAFVYVLRNLSSGRHYIKHRVERVLSTSSKPSL
jgi:hypothetical protein